MWRIGFWTEKEKRDRGKPQSRCTLMHLAFSRCPSLVAWSCPLGLASLFRCTIQTLASWLPTTTPKCTTSQTPANRSPWEKTSSVRTGSVDCQGALQGPENSAAFPASDLIPNSPILQEPPPPLMTPTRSFGRRL